MVQIADLLRLLAEACFNRLSCNVSNRQSMAMPPAKDHGSQAAKPCRGSGSPTIFCCGATCARILARNWRRRLGQGHRAGQGAGGRAQPRDIFLQFRVGIHGLLKGMRLLRRQGAQHMQRGLLFHALINHSRPSSWSRSFSRAPADARFDGAERRV